MEVHSAPHHWNSLPLWSDMRLLQCNCVSFDTKFIQLSQFTNNFNRDIPFNSLYRRNFYSDFLQNIVVSQARLLVKFHQNVAEMYQQHILIGNILKSAHFTAQWERKLGIWYNRKHTYTMCSSERRLGNSNLFLMYISITSYFSCINYSHFVSADHYQTHKTIPY